MGGPPTPMLVTRSPLYLRRLLGAACRPGGPPAILDCGGGPPVTLALEGLGFETGQRCLQARLIGDLPVPLAGRTGWLSVGGRTAARFATQVLEQRRRHLLLAYPVEVKQPEARQSTRVALADDGPAVGFEHPAAGTPGRLLDVSDRGLRVRLPPALAPLRLGETVALTIKLPSERLSALAIVRRCAAATAARIAGLEITGFGRPSAQATWRRYVFDCAFPDLSDGAGAAERTWELLERSGYLDQWTDIGDRAGLRAEYAAVWEAPDPTTGRSLIARTSGEAGGVIATSLLYPGTWIIHHLGRTTAGDEPGPDHLAQIGALMRASMQTLESDPDCSCFMIYVERGTRWNERLYQDFADGFDADGRLLLSPLTVFRRRADAPTPAAAGVEVVPASGAALEPLAARLHDTLPPLVRRAMALDRGGLDLGAFAESCRRRGYQRGRTIFLAPAGRPEAALIAESGSEGTNLFNLLNACHIVPLGPAIPAAAVYRALLLRAAVHYRDLGKRGFLLLGAAEGAVGASVERAEAEALGFACVSAGLRWIADRSVMPSWGGYLNTMLTAAAGAAANAAAPASLERVSAGE
jgi:hypothetical protein